MGSNYNLWEWTMESYTILKSTKHKTKRNRNKC